MEKSIATTEQRILQDILRQIRLGAGLTQKELAERLGKHQPFVWKYENGERRLDLIELRQVCVAAGVTLPEFVGRFEKALR